MQIKTFSSLTWTLNVYCLMETLVNFRSPDSFDISWGNYLIILWQIKKRSNIRIDTITTFYMLSKNLYWFIEISFSLFWLKIFILCEFHLIFLGIKFQTLNNFEFRTFKKKQMKWHMQRFLWTGTPKKWLVFWEHIKRCNCDYFSYVGPFLYLQ